MSKRLKNKPRHPAKLAADVVERVLFTDGDRYLWPHGDAMPWWQLSLLDVKAFLGVAALLIGSLVGLICIGVARMVLAGCRHLWHGVAQSKVHKQKSV